MKTSKYQRRFYRDWVEDKRLHRAHIVDKETDLQILTDKPVNENFIREKVRRYRGDIEGYIAKDRRFLTALKPLAVEFNARPVIKEMARSAEKANVGPMAAVAGVIAQFLGKDLLKKGYKDVIIENGGDIFIATTKIRRIGIYAGKSKLWNKLCLQIYPKNTPLGVCTSSGTVGHSLSFGRADSAIILSRSVSLADAVATAAANRVRSKEDLLKVLRFTRAIRGVSGAVIIFRGNLASWGKVKFA